MGLTGMGKFMEILTAVPITLGVILGPSRAFFRFFFSFSHVMPLRDTAEDALLLTNSFNIPLFSFSSPDLISGLVCSMLYLGEFLRPAPPPLKPT